MPSLPTIRTLLSNTVDYAGTFPPAQLTVENALVEAGTHVQWMKCPWLYSKMVLPFDEIKKIKASQYLQVSPAHFPWYWTALSCVNFDETHLDTTFKNIVWELREIEKWNEKNIFGSFYRRIFSYEVKISEGNLSVFLDQLIPLSQIPLTIYLEVPFTSLESGATNKIAQTIETFVANRKSFLTFGLKVRTGGTHTPTAEMLSSALFAAVTHQLKFKATQGLHEVVSHGKDFGFLNLFAALNFLQHEGPTGCSPSELEALLQESDPLAFSFSDKGFSWKDLKMTVDEIETARRFHGGSFGSCSLKEPDDSLFHTYLESK